MKIYLLAGIVSTLLTVIFGFIFIPILKKLKFGQNILGYVDKHKSKNGTPTMGGVFFMLAVIITFIIFSKIFLKATASPVFKKSRTFFTEKQSFPLENIHKYDIMKR